MRIASVNWEMRKLESEQGFFDHLDAILTEAAQQSVNIVVLPEFFAIELITLVSTDTPVCSYPQKLCGYFPAIKSFLQQRSDQLQLCVVAGSHFRQAQQGIYNSCIVSSPDLESIVHDKRKLIPYEFEPWHLSAGSRPARTFYDQTAGVQICYEVEFPGITAELAASGMNVLSVPSHTDTVRGFNRVRWCCHARTVEWQIFVAHSCLVGELPEYDLQGYGSSAVLSPCDKLISDTGVLASTELNREGMAVADLDFELLHKVRTEGEVQNWLDAREPQSS